MAAEPALRLVQTPEVALADEVAALHDQLAGAQRDIRAWRARYAKLERDKRQEAQEHEAWPLLLALHDYWREQTLHLRARWDADKFWMALNLWQTFGSGNCAAGIAGIAYQPNRKQLRNGKWETYDSWKLLFRDSDTLERYIKRRPKDWVCPERFRPEG